MDHDRASLGRTSNGMHINNPNEIRARDLIHGQLEVISLIGQGSSASVFKCKHLALGNLTVAVKIFPEKVSSNPLAVKRLGREIMAAHVVDHPNVARFYDCIRDGGFITLISEYVDGGTLEEYIKSSEPSLTSSFNILYQIASGLVAIHAAGVIHRDLKPLNILVGTNNIVRITDFGIVSLKGGEGKLRELVDSLRTGEMKFKEDPRQTQNGRLVGTPYYLSPEYLEKNIIDERLDIYAFGVIAYELVTRQVPFESENLFNLIQSKLMHDPRPPHRMTKHCSPELSNLIMRCMHRDPEQRVQSARQLQYELQVLRSSARHSAGTEYSGERDNMYSLRPESESRDSESNRVTQMIHRSGSYLATSWDGIGIFLICAFLIALGIAYGNPVKGLEAIYKKVSEEIEDFKRDQ